MDYFDRSIISIHDDADLEDAELILKDTIESPVRKLPLATFQEHEKQENDDVEDGSDKLTNQSVGGLHRARSLASENGNDTLPAVYGGLFTVAEYFTRSFDAIKGKFFEKVIAAEDPNEILVVDQNISELPQYILQPNAGWRSLSYTSETLDQDEGGEYERLNELNLDLGTDNKSANADATLYFEDDGVLVFGEHRTSVVSGGTTARPSLLRKPEALVEELVKNDIVLEPDPDFQDEYGLDDQYSFFGFLRDRGISDIHFHIGILFNENRRPASWEDDPQQTTSKRLIRQFRQRLPSNVSEEMDDENMRIDVTIPDPEGGSDEIVFHLSCLYGDIHLNSLYTGSLAAVGEDGDIDDFEQAPVSLREIIHENESDDLWLNFSIAERENKAYELSDDGTNNAIRMVHMILRRTELANQLISFGQTLASGSRDEIDSELNDLSITLAEEFANNVGTDLVENVYDSDPRQYLRDVAIQVIMYHFNTRPIFLHQLSDERLEDNPRGQVLADARATFRNYVYDIDQKNSTRERIYPVVRSLTYYEGSGETSPDGPNDRIDWAQAPTKQEIGSYFDRAPTRQMNIMVGEGDYPGQVLEKRRNKYAVPAHLADRIDPFLTRDI